MKRIIAVLAVLMLVCVLVGAQAFAAGEREKGQTYERGTTQQQHMTTGERARMGEQPMANRASEIIGSTVKNEKGEQLGTVNDIVLDRRGEVQYIILSHGGLLGIGDKLIPIPFRAARMQEDTVVLQNVDKQKLEQAPNISQQEWEKLAQPDFERKVYSYYGQEQREPGTMRRWEEQPRQRQQQ